MAIPIRRRLAITLVALLLLLPLIAFRAINSPKYQQRVLSAIARATPWKISVEKLEWSFINSQIDIHNLTVHQRKTLAEFHADTFSFQYSPWRFFIAQLGIRDIQAQNIWVDLSHTKTDKEAERLNWSRILLLRNLRIRHAQLDKIAIKLPEEQTITADQMILSFLPNLLRQINLKLNVTTIQMTEGKGEASAVLTHLDKFMVDGLTNVSNWTNTAPYVNDIEGKLRIDEMTLGNNTLNYLSGKLDYNDLRIGLEELDSLVNGKEITGQGFVDLGDENFNIDLNIPNPVDIHEPWEMPKTIRLAGTVIGKIHLEGEKFSMKAGKGNFALDITHTPKNAASTVPFHLTAKGKWANGNLQLDPSILAIQEGQIRLSGKIGLDTPSLNIPFTIHSVPLSPVFGRFSDENFHPIVGDATGQGTMRGWGKTFVVDGIVDVVRAGYVPIEVEKAHVLVKATTGKLTLNGDIYQNGRATGHCDLDLTLRAKHEPDPIILKATLDHHELGPTMKAFGWTGNAVANYEIHGVTSKIAATGKAVVTKGSISDIPFERVTLSVHMGNRDIYFDGGEIDIKGLPLTPITSPVHMALTKGQFAFSGNPTPQWHLKGIYRYIGKVWQVEDISFTDKNGWKLALSGTSSNSNLAMHLRGTANAELFTFFKTVFRDADGPLKVDLALKGPAGNPNVNGTIALQSNSLLLRSSPYRAENLQGTLVFAGKTARLDGISGTIDDGPFALSGTANWDRFAITQFDLGLKGSSLRYAALGGPLRLELDTDLRWSGTPSKSRLSGKLVIEDGIYTQDFNIIDQFTGGRADREALLSSIDQTLDKNVSLDLRVSNAGEIRVRNNVADVTLRANMIMGGTLSNPTMLGTIQTEDGILKYLGLQFAITRGIVEFRNDMDNPYIEFVGERDVYSAGDQSYLVMLTMKGRADSLQYDLSSNPPQDRQNLISLLTVGATQEEIRNRALGGSSPAQSVAGQVGSAVLQPVSSLLYLDTFQLSPASASSTAVSGSQASSRLYLGKRLSDRLNLTFATDIGGTNPQQAMLAEYQLTDYLLVKGGQTSDQNFGLNLTLRFRER